MTLADLLLIKFPGIDFKRDVRLRNDGQEDYIEYWNLEDQAKPTQEQLNQWQNDAATQQQYIFQQNKVTNKAIYDELDAIDIKSIRALRTNDTQRLTSLEAQAAALRLQLLPTS